MILLWTINSSYTIIILLSFGGVVEWQTRLTQNQVSSRMCRFKSCHRYIENKRKGFAEMQNSFFVWILQIEGTYAELNKLLITKIVSNECKKLGSAILMVAAYLFIFINLTMILIAF